MLDNVHPPARLVAQMRAMTKEQKLPDTLADMMAATPGMSAEKAKDLLPGVKFVAQRVQPDQRDKAIRLFLANATRPPEPADPYADDSEAGPDPIMVAASNAVIEMQIQRAGPETREPTFSIGQSWDSPEGSRQRLVAGMTAKIDPRGDHGAMGRDAAQMSIADMAKHVCRMHGFRPFNEVEAVRMAAHSTSDFPLILESSMTNVVARRIEQRMPDIIRAGHEVTRDDYRSGRSLTLSATGAPQEVKEGGEVKFVTASAGGEFLPQLRDFASGFSITNQALVNDASALGLLNDVANRMVEGAIERLRSVILEPIVANSGDGQTMADGTVMFHADHGNVAASGGAPSITTLSAARTAMRKQTGRNGELLAIEPWALVVPAELETTAQQILASINAATTSDVNPFQNSLELIVEPGLTDPAAWYLIGNPESHDGLAYAYLEGLRTPRVETREGWNTLGTEMRLVWALDAKFIETRSWYRNPGA